jgi:hypothetical protein
MYKVTKSNRRLTMAACLVLAYKFNEPMTISGTASKLPALWSFIDSEVCIPSYIPQLYHALHLHFINVKHSTMGLLCIDSAARHMFKAVLMLHSSRVW